MNKLYFSLALIFLFIYSLANNRKSESGFDRNRRIQDADENEIIFQLKEMDNNELNPNFIIPNKQSVSNFLNLDDPNEFVIEIGSNQSPPKSSLLPLSDEQPANKNLKKSSIITSENQKDNPISQQINKEDTRNKKNKQSKFSIKSKNNTDTISKIKSRNQTQKFKPLNKEQLLRQNSVKESYQKGEYLTVAKSNFKDNEFESLYYQAIACYNILKNNKAYQGRVKKQHLKEKNALINKAKDNLFHVGRFTPDKNLKERSILWYGLLSFTYPDKYYNEKELTYTFLYIEDKMKNSNIYNDAMIYLTLIYRKLGKTDKAKEYYQKAIKTSPNDPVYNYKTDTMVRAKKLWDLFADLQ